MTTEKMENLIEAGALYFRYENEGLEMASSVLAFIHEHWVENFLH